MRNHDFNRQPGQSSPDGEREGASSSRGNDWYRAGTDSRPTEGPENSDRGASPYYEGTYRRSSAPYRDSRGAGTLRIESWTFTGPYAGLGPKGYRRSDEQMRDEACQILQRDGEVDARDIEVTCENGVITLTGAVHDRQSKRRAEQCAESVYGITDVMNQLRVEPRSDVNAAAHDTTSSSA